MLSRFRKLVVIGAGAALLVGLTAGTLSAASPNSKTYTVTVSPTNLAYSTSPVSSLFTVTYTNLTPSATINSLTLTAPSGYQITTTNPSLSASSGNLGNYSAVVDTTGTTITVTNLYPVGYQQTVSLTFPATVDTSSITCSDNVGTWVTTAWTGSNLSGNKFALTGNAPTTTIGTALAPGASITVNGVTVTNDGTSCVPVTISRNGNSVQILKPNSGVALTVDVLWDPEPAVLPLPVTQVSDTFNTTPHDIEWCSGTSSAPALPGDGEVSCLVSESSQIYGPDGNGTTSTDWVPNYDGQLVQVHDVMYLLGDWGAQR